MLYYVRIILNRSLESQVISNRMQKSVLVAIDRFVKHSKYNRILKRTTKLMVRVFSIHPSLLYDADPFNLTFIRTPFSSFPPEPGT